MPGSINRAHHAVDDDAPVDQVAHEHHDETGLAEGHAGLKAAAVPPAEWVDEMVRAAVVGAGHGIEPPRRVFRRVGFRPPPLLGELLVREKYLPRGDEVEPQRAHPGKAKKQLIKKRGHHQIEDSH